MVHDNTQVKKVDVQGYRLGETRNIWQLQCKKAVYERWNQGQATKEKCTNVAWPCRDDVRKAKVHLKLTFARDLKGNKKTSYHCGSSNKRLNKENVSSFLNGAGDLVIVDTEKTEVLNAFSVSSFPNKVLQAPLLRKFERKNYQQWLRIHSGII